MSSSLIEALFLQSGYNASLVAIGATLLGITAGSGGTFLFLRKRALVSDAIAHATLPGIGIAFICMVALGGDGRNLTGLLIGSAVTATAGLLIVEWMTRATRLDEDAAIGAVLSVFFGFGVVLLTVIQNLSSGRQAGLESFLLGSTAGMLFEDAVLIAVGGAIVLTAIYALRRPLTLVAFDPEYASSTGINVRQMDLAMMGIVMAVTVVGLKIVGLILVVAMLIIPAVTARFWSEQTDRVVWMAGIVGGLSGYVGSAISVAQPGMPTGPVIVLVCFTLFVLSLLFAPGRGVIASLRRHRDFQLQVHRRQGLLAIAHNEPIFDQLTLSVLAREKLIRPDGVATERGNALATKARRDEHRWDIVRKHQNDLGLSSRYDGLTDIETLLTPDELNEIDQLIGPPSVIK
ncbi:MAG: metal ABC transporter permease [Pseudomonadota bacterium]